MSFPYSQHWWTEITLLRFTDSQGKKERRFYDKQFKSSRVTFLYLYIRNQECTTTNTTKNFFLCACVSRSSHIIIYMFAAFITTLQYNHIVTVWLVVSLLLYAYVNLLWCCASALVSRTRVRDGRMIIPPPSILTFSNLYKSAIKYLQNIIM